MGSQETSKEKVREIAKKLDIPFTNDLLALGSNAAISDALIEQAMANGKTDAEINEAMAMVWKAQKGNHLWFEWLRHGLIMIMEEAEMELPRATCAN